MDIFADRMGRHWASIERAMKTANRNRVRRTFEAPNLLFISWATSSVT